MRRMDIAFLVLALAAAGCASAGPEPSAAPAAITTAPPPAPQPYEYATPRLSARAHCFQSGGVWRPTAYVCEGVRP
jgi:hypothetical protein